MKHFTKIILAITFLSIIFIIVGQNFLSSISDFISIFLIGIIGILFGLEAIKKRIFSEQSRYDRRDTETYYGIAAISQGIILIFVGLFLCCVSALAYFDIGASVFTYFIRHPGIPLILFGIYCLAFALTAIIGYQEQKQGPKWNVILELITSRLLPGIILIVIAIIAIAVGIIEIFNPDYFDKMGGGFLEILFKVN